MNYLLNEIKELHDRIQESHAEDETCKILLNIECILRDLCIEIGDIKKEINNKEVQE